MSKTVLTDDRLHVLILNHGVKTMTTDKNRVNGKDRIKVLVVDDHPIVRQGLKLLLNLEPDIMVCAEAEDESTASAALQAFKPDIAVIDISLKNSDGIKLIKNI
jgi:PleD family two-component response regulator